MQTHHIILVTSKNKTRLDHNTLLPKNNRSLVVIIGFKQYSFVQNETVDKEYNQYYHQNNTSSVNKQSPFLQNNRLLLQKMTAQAAQLNQWLLKTEQYNDRSRSIYTTSACHLSDHIKFM